MQMMKVMRLMKIQLLLWLVLYGRRQRARSAQRTRGRNRMREAWQRCHRIAGAMLLLC
jgi:hypothetical protein